jgi:hypothetical protein
MTFSLARLLDRVRARPATARSRFGYDPELDGHADPGEIVWAWVPYEEDPTQGKDRPVLVVGTDGEALLALQMTSKDHDRDARQEASVGRYWMDIGVGDWDPQRRPSEVRLNRLLKLRPTDVRREGAVLPRPLFDAVVDAAGKYLA